MAKSEKKSTKCGLDSKTLKRKSRKVARVDDIVRNLNALFDEAVEHFDLDRELFISLDDLFGSSDEECPIRVSDYLDPRYHFFHDSLTDQILNRSVGGDDAQSVTSPDFVLLSPTPYYEAEADDLFES